MNLEENECVYDKELEDNNIDIDYCDSDYYDEIIPEGFQVVECAFCTRKFYAFEMEFINDRPCCPECFFNVTGLEDLSKDNDEWNDEYSDNKKYADYDEWNDEYSDNKKYADEKEQYIYKKFMKLTEKTRLGHNMNKRPLPRGYIKGQIKKAIIST